MSAISNDLHSVIGGAVTDAGFRKSGSLWSKRTPESIMLIEPQKSQYANTYFLNLGVYFSSLGDEKRPRAHRAHVQARLEGLVPKLMLSALEEALDFEQPKGVQLRASIIGGALTDWGLPFLHSHSTLEGVGSVQAAGQHPAVLIRRELLQL